MKSICITGAFQPDLQMVSDILQQGGMKLSTPVKRDASIDMAFWHEQVLAMAKEESGEIQPIPEPGKLWEQLASDIFVANIKSTLWGWEDSRSVWLLDFWLNFDPRLNFILVCESPQKTLARAMTNGAEAVSVGTVMNTWQAHHEELLRFHHRNPHRSLLVDAHDCAERPRALIERCVAQWKLSLPFVVAAVSPHQVPDSLALYLGHQLCQDYPDSIGLQHELAATVTHLGEMEQVPNTAECAPEPARIIADYRNLRDRSAELQYVQAAFGTLNSRFDNTVINHTRISAELQQVRVAFEALSSRFEEAVGNHAQIQLDLESRIKETTGENELLLLQLLQIQEELEVTLLEIRARTESLCGAETRLKEADQENELLRLQQRQVQEELEHYFMQHQDAEKQIKAAEERWQRMLQRIPDYRDDDSVEFLPAETGDDNANTRRRNSRNGSGHSLTKLEIKTVAAQRIAGPLTRWPANAANHLMQSFTRLLKSTPEPPAILRYDRVSLKREQVNPDYEHLWLRFENLALGDKRWLEFEFRLSCADVRPNHFGRYPKLEFPEDSSQSPFEDWFIESYDNFGAKLELRFALPESKEPESMDLEVWQRVSHNDRTFLSALIASLPAILHDLKSAGIHLKRPWDDWVQMALEIQRVVLLRATLQPARTKSLPAKAASASKSHKAQ